MRNRSLALVTKEEKILIVQTHRFGRDINELPGGGIEQGETPEHAAVRELFEECCVKGEIVRPLNVLHRKNGNTEYVFLVELLHNQEIRTGYDPEVKEGEVQDIKNVCWMDFKDLSYRDMAYMWSYGLMDVDGPWNGAKYGENYLL